MDKLDSFDLRLLTCLQKDASLSQRDLAERVGLSQNACWRRLQRLEAAGLLQGSGARVNLKALGLDLTVFVMIRTRRHAREWSERFKAHVERLPEALELHRIGGEWDYMIKVVVRGMAGYDAFYQKLVDGFEFTAVMGLFSMEAMIDGRPADLLRLG